MDASAPESRSESTPQQQSDFTAIWGWTGVLFAGMTVVGSLGGRELSNVLAMISTSTTGPDFELTLGYAVRSALYSGSIYGAALGIAQWFVLRRFAVRTIRCLTGRQALAQPEKRFIRDMALWIIATLVAVTGWMLLAMLVSTWLWLARINVTGLGFALYLLDGLFLGMAQWLLLRWHVPRASRWIWWTTVGLFLGHVVNLLSSYLTVALTGTVPGSRWMTILLYAFPGWLLLGLSQAFCLKRIAPGWIDKMRQRVQQAPVCGP